MPRDVACGAEVDTGTPFKLVLGGQTYYFCSQECLDDFLEDQEIVTEATEEDVRAGG
jgi:YHS domain-containing protein